MEIRGCSEIQEKPASAAWKHHGLPGGQAPGEGRRKAGGRETDNIGWGAQWRRDLAPGRHNDGKKVWVRETFSGLLKFCNLVILFSYSWSREGQGEGGGTSLENLPLVLSSLPLVFPGSADSFLTPGWGSGQGIVLFNFSWKAKYEFDLLFSPLSHCANCRKKKKEYAKWKGFARDCKARKWIRNESNKTKMLF